MYGDIVMQLLRGPYPLLNANIGREQILALYKNEFPKGKIHCTCGTRSSA